MVDDKVPPTATSITKNENVQTSVSLIITTHLREPGSPGFLNYTTIKKTGES
jgi:hypothetical protein